MTNCGQLADGELVNGTDPDPRTSVGTHHRHEADTGLGIGQEGTNRVLMGSRSNLEHDWHTPGHPDENTSVWFRGPVQAAQVDLKSLTATSNRAT